MGPTQQILRDTFTMGSKGEKNLGESFSVQCVYFLFSECSLVLECMVRLAKLHEIPRNMH